MKTLRLRAEYLRGGTSKGVFFRTESPVPRLVTETSSAISSSENAFGISARVSRMQPRKRLWSDTMPAVLNR